MTICITTLKGIRNLQLLLVAISGKKLKVIYPINFMGGPGEFTVAEYRVRDRDYEDWGISNEAGRSVEIRFSGRTERGTKFTDGVLFLIGDKTPDGESYYALPAAEAALSPVLRMDAEWSDTLFELVENVPYGDEG